MFSKFATYIKDCFWVIKRVILESKTHFYISTACLFAGLLIALSKDFSTIDSTKNFVFVIVSGNASPIPHFLKLLLWTSSLYLLLYLSSTHYFSFWIFGYGGICISSYIVFFNAFKAVAVHPLSGFLYLLLYLLPTIIIIFIGQVCALREIYKLLNFDCNKKSIINLGFHLKSIKKTITPIWIIYSLLAFAYWIIFYLILIIFV